MTITQFREAVVNLCINSGYPNNGDEIKFVTVEVTSRNDGLTFMACTSRKISDGNHRTIYVSRDTIDECLKVFEERIRINHGENDIDLA